MPDFRETGNTVFLEKTVQAYFYRREETKFPKYIYRTKVRKNLYLKLPPPTENGQYLTVFSQNIIF